VTHVKQWSAKNKMSYGCAISNPECKKAYHIKKGTKSVVEPLQAKERESMGEEDERGQRERKQYNKKTAEKKITNARKAKIQSMIDAYEGAKAYINAYDDLLVSATDNENDYERYNDWKEGTNHQTYAEYMRMEKYVKKLIEKYEPFAEVALGYLKIDPKRFERSSFLETDEGLYVKYYPSKDVDINTKKKGIKWDHQSDRYEPALINKGDIKKWYADRLKDYQAYKQKTFEQWSKVGIKVEEEPSDSESDEE
jgi:hypothetical protein